VGEKFVDVRDYYPFALVEPIETVERNQDTLRAEFMRDIDLSLKQEVFVDSFTDFHTLDIAKRDSALSR
jgi:hypothetical protein